MKLSKRLQAVADIIPKSDTIADIGTDHGYIPIYAIKNQLSKKAIAMDVNPGPLERAKYHIKEEGLEAKIECRLSDGLEKLAHGEADTIVIAGMGADLICNILSAEFSTKHLILSPHTHQEKVRIFLRTHGYKIVEENMIFEDNKFYNIIRADYLGENADDIPVNDYFGEYLLKNNHPVLKMFLEKEIEKYKDIPQKKDYLELVINGVDQTVAAAQTKECR